MPCNTENLFRFLLERKVVFEDDEQYTAVSILTAEAELIYVMYTFKNTENKHVCAEMKKKTSYSHPCGGVIYFFPLLKYLIQIDLSTG